MRVDSKQKKGRYQVAQMEENSLDSDSGEYEVGLAEWTKNRKIVILSIGQRRG
jgi:hypothetical protein